MTFEELRNKLSLEQQKFSLLKEEFQRKTGEHRPEVFLKYLRETKAISEAEYKAVAERSEPPIDLVPVDGSLVMSTDGPLPRVDMIRLLGEGAMGEVHLAKDVALKRNVALKLIKSEILDDEVTRVRFVREILITAQLDHPNIIPVYTLEQAEDGSLAYTMKVIRGRTLEDLIHDCRKEIKAGKKPSINLEERLEIFFKLCDAISYAHARKVIHRDLKPENIMLGPFGEVYVMDWGVAHVMGLPEEQMDPEGSLVGTLTYISPEQVQGEVNTLTPASDQYALGLILQELVSLKPALPVGKTFEDLFRIARRGQKNDVVHLDPKVNIRPELIAIINKSTQNKVNERYTSVDDMCEDIRRFLREEPVSARKDPIFAKVQRWIYHNRNLAIFMFVMVVIIALVSNMIHMQIQHKEREAAMEREKEQDRLARAHEQALGEVLTTVAAQGQRIDQQFLHYRGLLRSIGVSAEVFLQAEPQTHPVFFNLDFPTSQNDVAVGPTDLRASKRYGMQISIDHPVIKLAPGVDKVANASRIQQVSGLLPYYRQTLLQSLNENAVNWDRKKIRDQIAETGVPAVWAFVGLEEGIHCAYPGKGGYSASYDPRQRPWYEKSKNTHGPKCSDPYLDSMGQGLLLPCTMALYDVQKKFIGVAGLEFTLQFIVDELLDISSYPQIEDSFLVDEKGHIIVKSSERKPELDADGKLLLKEYPNAKIKADILQQKSGYLIEENRLYVYHHMNSLGWFYIIEGDATELLGVLK